MICESFLVAICGEIFTISHVNNFNKFTCHILRRTTIPLRSLRYQKTIKSWNYSLILLFKKLRPTLYAWIQYILLLQRQSTYCSIFNQEILVTTQIYTRPRAAHFLLMHRIALSIKLDPEKVTSKGIPSQTFSKWESLSTTLQKLLIQKRNN